MDDNTVNTYFKSKWTPLIILAVMAIVCSRVIFFFINDPEGPNLVVVLGLAMVVFLLSLGVYKFSPVKTKEINTLWAAICTQVLAAIILYFCMK